jgi:hypothetical protein
VRASDQARCFPSVKTSISWSLWNAGTGCEHAVNGWTSRVIPGEGQGVVHQTSGCQSPSVQKHELQASDQGIRLGRQTLRILWIGRSTGPFALCYD